MTESSRSSNQQDWANCEAGAGSASWHETREGPALGLLCLEILGQF